MMSIIGSGRLARKWLKQNPNRHAISRAEQLHSLVLKSGLAIEAQQAELCENSLALLEKADDQEGLANCWPQLGDTAEVTLFSW